VAIAFEFLAPIVAVGKLTGPPTHEHHFRERYAIFTIIVFGETFVKTLTELAEQGASLHSQIFGGGVFLIAVGLWWTYFDDVADSNVRRGRPVLGVAWAYAHLPLLFAGSIAVTLAATAVLDLLTISPHHAVRNEIRAGSSLACSTGRPCQWCFSSPCWWWVRSPSRLLLRIRAFRRFRRGCVTTSDGRPRPASICR